MQSKPFEDLLRRIRAEYSEMPGLRLTTDQASRLCGLERDQCDEILRVLVDRGFLIIGTDDKYGRPTDCPLDVRTTMAKATLKGERTAIADTPAGRRAGGR